MNENYPAMTELELAYRALETERLVLLRGLAGTGKTFAAQRIGVRPGQPVYETTLFGPDQTPQSFLGSYQPDGNGGWRWRYGYGSLAWLNNGRLIVNEISNGSDEVMDVLYGLTDNAASASITLENGETIRPGSGFSFVATMNDDVDALPEALADRLCLRFTIDTPAEEAFAELPERYRAAAIATVALPGADRISLRRWYTFARFAVTVGEENAARTLFGARGSDVLDAIAVGNATGPEPEPLMAEPEPEPEADPCDCDSCNAAREELAR